MSHLLYYIFTILFCTIATWELSGQGLPESISSGSDSAGPVQEKPASYKLGSHHSLSFKKPRWYWQVLNWSAKCQDVDIDRQLECGVVYFDLRVRFKKDKVISGHGVIDYNIDIYEQLDFLNNASSEERPVYVRIMYESKPLRKNPTIEEMKNFMADIRERYPNLVFTECHIRNPYTLVERYEDIPKKNCYPFYKNYDAKNFFQKIKGLKFPYPRHFAKKQNHTHLPDTIPEEILIFDFINIKICP